MKKGLVIVSLLMLTQGLFAQKESNLLKKHEIQLLGLLLSDTINNTNITLTIPSLLGLITNNLPIQISSKKESLY